MRTSTKMTIAPKIPMSFDADFIAISFGTPINDIPEFIRV